MTRTSPAQALADAAEALGCEAELRRLVAALAPAVAARLRLPRGKPATRRGPTDMRGVTRHGRSWQVNTTVKGWRVVQGGFATEVAAKEWQARLRADEDALNEWLARRLVGAKVTVRDVLQYYYAQHANKLTAADRCEDHARHLCKVLGDELAAGLRQRHVDEYLTSRSAAAKTCFNELAYLRSALLYAWRNDKLRERPRFVLHRPKCERKRVAWPEEARRLYAAADLPMQRVILAAYSMGLRRGEILAARWSWVHGRTLILPGEATKTSEEASVEIPPQLWDLLEQEPRHREALFCRWDVGGRPREWRVRTLYRQWVDLCAAAGCANLWLHDMRRSMSSVGQARGHSRAAVRAIGRWQDAATMDRHYSHAGPGMAAGVAVDLAGVVVGQPAAAGVDEAEEAAVRAVLALLRKTKGERSLVDTSEVIREEMLPKNN